jgi:AraC-like DNA-binding protein
MVRPGDIFLLDLTQPIESFAKNFDTLFFIVPRGMLFSKLPQLERLHGKVLPRESAVAKLLAAHIKTLYSVSHSLTENEACSVAEGVVNLTGTYFNQTLIDEDCQHIQAATRESIRCYIIKNLGNPDLTAESIAHHFKISRAYLYRLFDSSEGITHYIYERRLLKAFNCLRTPGNSTMLISQIAYSLGFNSESHFSRSFRQFFGITPSEVRNNARTDCFQQNTNPITLNKVFEKWMLSLH